MDLPTTMSDALLHADGVLVAIVSVLQAVALQSTTTTIEAMAGAPHQGTTDHHHQGDTMEIRMNLEDPHHHQLGAMATLTREMVTHTLVHDLHLVMAMVAMAAMKIDDTSTSNVNNLVPRDFG